MQALVDALTERRPTFARLWREQGVLGREGGERRFRSPARRFYQTTLIVASHPDVKLVSLTPLENR